MVATRMDPRDELRGVTLASRVRSTLIASSRAMLRENGWFERYAAHLTEEDRSAMDTLVPGVWVSIGLIRTHYIAIDRLGLTVAEQLSMGHGLSERMHKPVLAVGLRLANAAGITPWTLATQAVKMWPRAYDGGAFVVEQLGPKEAQVTIAGFPCADIRYCRIAWRGILLGGTELFSRRAYVNDVPHRMTATNLTYRVSWA
jgi:hypothetical protein